MKKKKRYKTLEQICDQAYRLYDACAYTDPARAHKILDIKGRYNVRINNLPEQQKLIQQAHGKPHSVSWALFVKRCGIKYPRIVYAGF